jgi:hypothetical protein
MQDERTGWGEDSQEAGGPPDGVPCDWLGIRNATDDVLKSHAMKDVGEEKDDHIGMLRGQGSGVGLGWGQRSAGGQDGHVGRGVRMLEERPGREGQPNIFLTS